MDVPYLVVEDWPIVSDALALVRFPDGEMRATIMGDELLPFLTPIAEWRAMWDAGWEPHLDRLKALHTNSLDLGDLGDIEDVEIWSDYGGGVWWTGRASRSAALVVEGANLDVIDPRFGSPAWVPGELPE